MDAGSRGRSRRGGAGPRPATHGPVAQWLEAAPWWAPDPFVRGFYEFAMDPICKARKLIT